METNEKTSNGGVGAAKINSPAYEVLRALALGLKLVDTERGDAIFVGPWQAPDSSVVSADTMKELWEFRLIERAEDEPVVVLSDSGRVLLETETRLMFGRSLEWLRSHASMSNSY